MPPVRRIVAATCFLALIAADSSAFKLDYHVEVTERAIALSVRDLPADVLAALKRLDVAAGGFDTVFTDEARQEIVDANRARDLGHCGNEFDMTQAATPCTGGPIYGEGLAAIVFLAAEPPEEHFDAESIPLASNKVFMARNDIRTLLLKKQFVGARKVLGGALHAIQDFYAHSNFIELGLPGIEERLGSQMDAFTSPSLPGPRVAAKNEPMCVDVGVSDSWLDSLSPDLVSAGRWIGTHLEGSVPFLAPTGEVADRVRLISQLSKAEQDRLVKVYADAEAKAGKPVAPITAAILRKVIADRPLTSGYFHVFYPEGKYSIDNLPSLSDLASGEGLPGVGDPPIITDYGKCRHGWEVPVFSRFGGKFTYRQHGINKDEPTRAGFSVAKDRALQHSLDFFKKVILDGKIRGRDDYPDLILGLLGYEPAGPLINRFTILKVPGAPPGQTMWDGVLEVFLNIWAVHPDIQTCVSVNGRSSCAPECPNADTWNPDRRCSQNFPFRLPATGSIRVEVWDNDPASRQRMAVGDIRVDDPCLELTAHPPCEIPGANAAEDTLLISFESPERSTIPSSLPEGAPPLPPAPGGGGGSGGGGGAGAGGGGAAPSPAERAAPTPGAPLSPAAPASAPGARTLTPSAAAALRTPEGIDAALRLRDADNCVGGDVFFPTGASLDASPVGRRLGPDQTSRLYQAAALFMVIADPTAKSNVLTAIQSRADGGDLIDLMNSFSPVQGGAIVAAYGGTAKEFAGQVVATGLNELLAPARPAAAIEPDVNRWIAKSLATAPLASEAVDRIFSSTRSVSAECTINQLAKDGFTDTVNGR